MATATATAAEPQRLSLFAEFRAFLDKYGVIGLAIAFVIGSALTVLVKAVVTDLLMPFVGLITPEGGWQQAVLYVPPLPAGSNPADPAFKLPAHTLALAWGDLLANAVNFIIIAAFVFLVAKFVLRQKEIGKL
ncbi:MAG: large conductance mechanosensitive channel [Thermoplasmata archaeon]|jgi:large conductance mechanosensitive channel|nr:large conductance mechanosensitive channel [Thermoplasmata archaeon]